MIEDLAQIAVQLARYRQIDPEQISSMARALNAYLRRRRPTIDQMTALISIAVDVGAESLGTSFFLRRFSVGDDKEAKRTLTQLGSRPTWESDLLFPPAA